MKFTKANATIHDHIIAHYKNKSLQELKSIYPKWAYGDNVDQILDYTQTPSANLFTILLVNTSDLIQHATFNEVALTSLFTENLINNSRIANILSRWEKQLYVDPPSIFLTPQSKIQFTDGRHRAKATYLLGHKEIPLAVNNIDLEQIITILNPIVK